MSFTTITACGECCVGCKKKENWHEASRLISNLDKLHTTKMGAERIKRNLCLDNEDVVKWCRQKIKKQDNQIIRQGKNWYITVEDCKITVNAHSYTIITAHSNENNKK